MFYNSDNKGLCDGIMLLNRILKKFINNKLCSSQKHSNFNNILL